LNSVEQGYVDRIKDADIDPFFIRVREVLTLVVGLLDRVHNILLAWWLQARVKVYNG